MAMFPDGIMHIDTEPQWKLMISTVMGYIALVFTFPFGWFVEALTAGVSTPPLYSPFYVPVNAYLWGWLASTIRGRKSAPGDLPSIHSN